MKVNHIISIPDIIDLAAMKAFALGRKSKWKDYVDLYFLLKDKSTIEKISHKAQSYFGDHHSEKMFRQQLAFHKDIDNTELIEYLINPVPEEEIKEFLIEQAINI